METKTKKIQHYFAEHITIDETCGFDDFYLGFLWYEPKIRVSKNDFINELVHYCDKNKINLKFMFDRATSILEFAKNE